MLFIRANFQHDNHAINAGWCWKYVGWMGRQGHGLTEEKKTLLMHHSDFILRFIHAIIAESNRIYLQNGLICLLQRTIISFFLWTLVLVARRRKKYACKQFNFYFNLWKWIAFHWISYTKLCCYGFFLFFCRTFFKR